VDEILKNLAGQGLTGVLLAYIIYSFERYNKRILDLLSLLVRLCPECKDVKKDDINGL